ncbi:hypothetical protein HRS9122_06875 [Pyrenophora teres f. teres]|nr:hypothetical protein HRS9122_06875 [Pyrenophora teres f. teres]
MATNRTKAKTKTKRKQRSRPFRPANRHATKNKKRKDPRTGPRPTRGPNGIKLKQQQYYKFTSDIRIYHYSAPYLSLHTFKTLLQRRAHGYVAALLGSDEALSRNMLTTPTDVIPPGALEVGYLPSVFAHGGSALGFRLGNGVVEWLCFDRDIKESVLDKLDINTETQRMLFDHVADLEKPVPVSSTSRKVPYTEHKDWYESLREAGWRPCVVRLGWRNFGWDIKDEILRRRRRALEEERDRGLGESMVSGDYWQRRIGRLLQPGYACAGIRAGQFKSHAVWTELQYAPAADAVVLEVRSYTLKGIAQSLRAETFSQRAVIF